eukprot:1236531-Pyramimonas_sp.AAC.1
MHIWGAPRSERFSSCRSARQHVISSEHRLTRCPRIGGGKHSGKACETLGGPYYHDVKLLST